MKLNGNKKILIAIIGLVICIFILYLLNTFSNKEPFVSNSPVVYSESTIKEYKESLIKWKVSMTIPAESLQKLGVPENSVKQYISTGSWDWSPELTNVVKQMIMNEPNYDETKAAQQLVDAQKVWPPEYFILIFSTGFARDFKSIANTKKLACNIDQTTQKAIGNSMYTLDESGKITTTPVDNSTLPGLMPGFKFLSKPCNPCNIINYNYDCPFAYPDTNGKTIFPGFLMEYAWGLYPYSKPNTNSNINSNNTNNTNNTSPDFSNLLDKFN